MGIQFEQGEARRVSMTGGFAVFRFTASPTLQQLGDVRSNAAA
jgi:hypothetical protein